MTDTRKFEALLKGADVIAEAYGCTLDYCVSLANRTGTMSVDKCRVDGSVSKAIDRLIWIFALCDLTAVVTSETYRSAELEVHP